MKARILFSVAIGSLVMSSFAQAQASAPGHQYFAYWRSFDVPGAGPLGTEGTGINDLGEITGDYSDATPSQQGHGFVRTPDGRIRKFDPAGSTWTYPTSINNFGTIVGIYEDGLQVVHGFVRTRNGGITTIDVPGSILTFVFDINDLGVITGWYLAATNNFFYGFVREPNGPYITIEGPNGAGTTFCFVVNTKGEAGCQYGADFTDGHQFWRGLLHHRDGSNDVFDGPGVADNTSCQGWPSGTEIGEYRSLTSAGVISGHWEDANCQIHGFVRGPGGRMETFSLPPSDIGALTESTNSINEFGTVVGFITDVNYILRGYVRFPGGPAFPVVPPDPNSQGIYPVAINSSDVFTGGWKDQHGKAHGFVARAVR
jgi:predicted membrane protein